MFKKLPSLLNLVHKLESAIKRFPLASLVALAGTILAILLVHLPSPEKTVFPNLLMTIILAFPLFVSTVLLRENIIFKKYYFAGINICVSIFLIIYYCLLPENIFLTENVFLFRYFMWAIGFFLLITFIGFVKTKEKTLTMFWHYNRNLFYALALTAIYAVTIGVGLCIALSSVEHLFELDINDKRYVEIWIILAGLFSPLFLLSRIPSDNQSPEDANGYPKELKLFSQFVLSPLISIYFIILYSYTIKILITGDWPKGVLAYMILGFSLLGIFTYVVLFPLREKLSWVKWAGTIFYIVLIPQVGMLFWALWFRISDYGFTEKRYLVFVFGWWLFAMAIYFLWSKAKDIRIIPATIFIITLLASFGPWGAFAISEKSQTLRLNTLLTINSLMTDGQVQKADDNTSITFDDRKEISATVRYLSKTHGLDSLQPLFSKDLNDLKNENFQNSDYYTTRYNLPEKIVEELIGIDYVENWEGLRVENDNYSFYSSDIFIGNALDISGYNYIYQLVNLSGTFDGQGKTKYKYAINSDRAQFSLFEDGRMITEIDLNQLIKDKVVNQSSQKLQPATPSPEKINVVVEDDKISLILYITHIGGKKKENGKYTVNHINATLLFTTKQHETSK